MLRRPSQFRVAFCNPRSMSAFGLVEFCDGVKKAAHHSDGRYGLQHAEYPRESAGKPVDALIAQTSVTGLWRRNRGSWLQHRVRWSQAIGR